MGFAGFVTAVACAALGVLAMYRLARHRSVLPTRTAARRVAPERMRQVAVATAAALVVVLVTRWPLAGVATGVCVLLWPRIFGGGLAGRRELEKIEAIASWTESLRDTASAAAGLEQAIPATVSAAQPLLQGPIRELAARLDGRVPLPEALARFADDVDDPSTDLVVAALSLNARQRAGGLERILSALAESSRAELEMRRKVELERRLLRRQAQRIAFAVIGFVLLQAVFARGWVEPYSTLSGQIVLATIGAIFVAAFVRMRSLSEVEHEPRFLAGAGQTASVPAFRPRVLQTGDRS